MSDHLGNQRISFSDKNGDGSIQISTDAHSELLNESQYYPFGLLHKGVGQQANGRKNPYLYNGKEFVEDFGLNWYDYGARWYDASIGRWNSVDPLAEKYYSMSGYNYVGNNPINSIDPNGDSIRIVNGNTVYQYTPGQEYDGDDSYVSGVVSQLNTMHGSGEAGKEVVSTLHSSEGNYYYVNAPTSSKDGVASFEAYGDTGEGGITYVTEENVGDINNLSHETFHGYQHETGLTPLGTDAAEVGAFLFESVISKDVNGLENLHFYSNGGISLLYDGYNATDYRNLVRSFKQSDKNSTGIYNTIKSGVYPDNPAIKKFLPLKK